MPLNTVNNENTTIDTGLTEAEEVKVNRKLFAIPATLDMVESVLKNIATTMIY